MNPNPDPTPLVELQKQLCQYATRYLGRFNSTSAKLTGVLGRYIERHQQPQLRPYITELVQRMADNGFLNDGEFALHAAHKALAAGKSRHQAMAWLLQKQLPAALSSQAVVTVYDQDLDDGDAPMELLAAQHFARKRRLGGYQDLEDRAARFPKEFAKMARAGFASTLCRQVLLESAV
jgi:regulatory protein